MISKDDAKKVAHLARIHLSDDKADRLAKNLEDILQYVKKLESVDVSNVKPTSHVLPLKNVEREDTVRPSLSQEDALKFAVQKENGAFKVPKVIE